MGPQRNAMQWLFLSRKYVLSSMFLCCLWVLTITSHVQAAAVGTVADAKLSFQSVSMPPPGVTYWQVKMTSSVSGLPKHINSIATEIRFTKKAKGAVQFSEFAKVKQSFIPVTMQAAQIDTGWIIMTAAPAQGDEYGGSLDVSYLDTATKSMERFPLKLVSPPAIPVP